MRGQANHLSRFAQPGGYTENMQYSLASLVVCLGVAGMTMNHAAPAQRRPAAAKPAAGYTLERIQVEGNRAIPAGKIIAATGLKIGQPAGKPEFEAARDRLVQSGAFDSVGFQFGPGPAGKGYAVTFQVAELPQQFSFRAEDLPVTTQQAAELFQRTVPLFSGKLPGNQVIFDQYAKRLQEELAKQGFQDKVVAKLSADTGDDTYVLFRPATPPASIAEVHFTGSKAIPAGQLQAAVSRPAIGAAYSETRMRQILDASVRPLYDAKGRLKVAFPKIETAKAKDVQGVIVTVTVEDGPVFELGKVTLVGVSPELLEEAKVKKGDLANFQEINYGAERIRNEVRRQGYLKAAVTVDRKLNEQRQSVDVTYRAEPGSPYTYGKLTIEGLDIQSEPVIRRLWGQKEGKPFNPDFPEFFLTQVKGQGLFDNLKTTKSAYKADDQSLTVDVTLSFNR